MESSVERRLTVAHRMDVGVPSTNDMEGPHSWLARLSVVGCLVAVIVDRCLDMKY